MNQEPAESMKSLARLIQTGDAEGIRRLAAANPALKGELNDPMPGGHFGATPLLAAAGKGDTAVIDALLDIGADIDARSHWWAGSFGVLDGNPKIAAHMIQRGATVDINAASHLNMIDRVKELLDADPTLVSHRGGDGQTPLHVAATVEIADLLLDRGADINARDIDHESTAAEYAVGDRIDVARRLVERGCDADILLACAVGDINQVRKLIDADPKVVETTVSEQWFPKRNPQSGGTIYIWTLGWNKTPQQIAHKYGHPEIVQLLRERSPAEINFIDACTTGDRATMERLLAEHPDFKSTIAKNVYHRIVGLAMDRNIEGVRLLLEMGCPPDAAGSDGATALHWAGFHGDVELARLLLKAGAPIDVVERTFQARPLGWATYGSIHGWYAKSGDYAGVVNLLLDAGAVPQSVLKDSDASPAVIDVLRNYRKNS
jgi:ankyrin repeat protein